MQHPEVHANNKTLAKKTADFLRHQMGMVANYAIHPLSKKEICVYSVENTNVGTTFTEWAIFYAKKRYIVYIYSDICVYIEWNNGNLNNNRKALLLLYKQMYKVIIC